jgi:uncharacterized membrane protein
MFSLYLSLKFLHVASVVFWIGAIASLNFMAFRFSRAPDAGTLGRLQDLFDYFGRRVIGPASGIALLAGIGMVISSRMSFMTPWILWGILGFLFHFIVGATVLRKNALEFARVAGAATPDQSALEKVRARQKTIATVYLLVMLSVIWAMVVKPA